MIINRKCRHHDASSYLVHRQVGIHSLWYRPCPTCHAWLSLGHSDEEPVRVEVRAAEFASLSVIDPMEMSLAMAHGWNNHVSRWPGEERLHQSDEWHAGYLARCIYEHKDGKP